MSFQTTLPLQNAAGNIQRHRAIYHPSLWTDYFLDYQGDCTSPTERSEKYEEVKVEVSKMLKVDKLSAKPLKERLLTVEAIKRLGVEYHFKQEIESVVKNIFDNGDDNEDDDLSTVAIRFRILREHGYNVPSDVFNKFKGKKGSVKQEIKEDITGMLSLYEAAYLQVHGEDILEEALSFTTTTLQSFLTSNHNPSLAKQVKSALWRPIRKTIPRLATWEFIFLYQDNENHDELLLKFAKLDFNSLQKQHQKELHLVSKWWKDLEMEKNFPYCRDRVVEAYIWALSLFYEPQYEMGRRFVAKLVSICTILDDTFDAYGTQEELELFTQALVWSEKNALEKLPSYMKKLCLIIEEVFNEMDQVMAKEGRSFLVPYVKKELKNLVKAYREESRWLHEKKIPSVEEYLKTSMVTSCYPLFTTASFLAMGELATKEAFDWLSNGPSILQASCLIGRVMDDIASHKFEQQREHIPSIVECYMNEYKVSEEIACNALNMQVENAWKDTNRSLLDPDAPPILVQTRMLNLSQMSDVTYKEGDSYTFSTIAKDLIDSLLCNQIEI